MKLEPPIIPPDGWLKNRIMNIIAGDDDKLYEILTSHERNHDKQTF